MGKNKNNSREAVFVDRLSREWIEFGKLIVAVDFDDTIYPHNRYKDCDEVISFLKEINPNIRIIINTARSKSFFPRIYEYCEGIGLIIETINTNCVPLPFGNDGKVYANIYLDDRAGLDQALSILRKAYINFCKSK